ncbi:acyltransferase domain-containing protein [Microbulbifer spongiae]|uniref:Acyltransferase domain-containing protein n=1 Tax=Microbulbifer spongiae TaxID=2944933 RepID=A0ABY9EB57_9GAMM|nr:acyltransferase domain-containing protein [Microbulbifer sp. MI-G]WKD49171.1 acyltransferase domain-containing protein [Microbulbifer sp. MI-G]
MISKRKPIVFMFSGQGSQYYGMGKELYNSNSRFRTWMDYCDEIIAEEISISIIQHLFSDEFGIADSFDDITLTNPALVAIEYCLAKILIEEGIKPGCLVGYSLGELSAAVIADAVSIEQGLSYSIRLARHIKKYVQQAGMLSVISDPDIYQRQPDLFSGTTIAGYNFHSGFVVSGSNSDLQKLKNRLQRLGIASHELAVKYGFHSAAIDGFRERFLTSEPWLVAQPGKIKMMSACTVDEVTEITQPYLWRIIREPVQFQQLIECMAGKSDYYFIDVGPSATLATFLKYILRDYPGSTTFETINPFGHDLKAINRLLQSFTAI